MTKAETTAARAAAQDQEIVVLHPTQTLLTRQELPNVPGITGATAGAKRISLNLVVIPPGGRARPHLHRGCETAIYVLSGRIETRYGAGLEKSRIHEAGDFIFIPADLPHQPVNLSATVEARAIVAHSDADEQRSVEYYDTAT
jgi:uncharacterized RmlC-like cupin family protein